VNAGLLLSGCKLHSQSGDIPRLPADSGTIEPRKTVLTACAEGNLLRRSHTASIAGVVRTEMDSAAQIGMALETNGEHPGASRRRDASRNGCINGVWQRPPKHQRARHWRLPWAHFRRVILSLQEPLLAPQGRSTTCQYANVLIGLNVKLLMSILRHLLGLGYSQGARLCARSNTRGRCRRNNRFPAAFRPTY